MKKTLTLFIISAALIMSAAAPKWPDTPEGKWPYPSYLEHTQAWPVQAWPSF